MPSASSLRTNPLSASERLLLDAARRLEPISRAALAGVTPLAQPSVHRNVESLLSRGLLQAGAPEKGLRGQPSPLITLVREALYSVGLCINADCVVVSLADMSCRVVEEVTVRTPPLSRQATLQAVKDVIQRLLARHAVPRERLVGIGVGIAGFALPGGRQFNASEPLRDWSLVDLAPLLEEALGYPVLRIENSGGTAAVGEFLNGIGRTVKSFCYLAVEHGFGGGILIDGQLHRGMNGNAGEVSGCLTPEEMERRPALSTLLQALRSQGVAVDSIEDLRQRFDPEWPGVADWVDSVMPQLDRVLNALSVIVDPEVIVFGGQAPAGLCRMLIARAQFWDQSTRYGVSLSRPRLVLSASNVDAAASGAAALLLKDLLYV